MVAKAKLVEIESFSSEPQAEKPGEGIEVQFNPESLRIAMANENRGGDQPGGSSQQFVGSGTTKLTVELLFDTTVEGSDVRAKTKEIAYFVMPKEQADQNNKRTPPLVRFEWGTFIFEGVVNSMDETLDYFSEEGVPLRATVALNMSRDEIVFLLRQPGQARGRGEGASGGGSTPGTVPLEKARLGESVQSMAGLHGKSSAYKAIAAANKIDDLLRLPAGMMLDMNAGIGAEAGFSAGLGGGAGFSADLGVGASASAGGAVGLDVSISGGIGAEAGVGVEASASATVGGGIGASGGIEAEAGVGASAGIGAGAGASAGGGFGFGVDIVKD
jgi:hypothetical protein